MYCEFDPTIFTRNFNHEPFGFGHRLHELDLFSADALAALARTFDPHPADHFVAAGAAAPGTVFYAVEHGRHLPSRAMELLDHQPIRILLKRPENHDERFRELLDLVFEEIVDTRGGLGGERVVRLQSSVLISSGATITPFHFDPEINFFAHIAGQKSYHVYSPAALQEDELERFYARQIVNIAQVPVAARDPAHEHVFDLRPGRGLHQPQNAPHWVKTGVGRSISFAIVFETDATRAVGRARAANHYLRRLGAHPLPPRTSQTHRRAQGKRNAGAGTGTPPARFRPGPSNASSSIKSFASFSKRSAFYLSFFESTSAAGAIAAPTGG